MRRRLLPWLPGLALAQAMALGSAAWADTPARVDITLTPAWQGWSRPGRLTELGILVRSDRAGQATLRVQAGEQTLSTTLSLVPGRPQALHLPMLAAAAVAVQLSLPDGSRQQHDLTLSRAEAPLLAVALAAPAPLALDGFHSLAVGPDDLPRQAAAYAGIDALVLDADTLGLLDPAQLSALLAHVANCGRLVLVNQDERVRQMLDAAAGCSGRALLHAAQASQAVTLLAAALDRPLAAVPAPPAMADGDAASHAVWRAVALCLACALAAMALALVFSASTAALLGVPALATLASLGLLQALPAASRLSIWSEADSGAPLARYQARQQVVGTARSTLSVPLPSLLAASAQPCLAAAPLHLDVDAGSGLARTASFESRLFHQFSVCYAGTFPVSRALAVTPPEAPPRQVRNTATQGWPGGLLLLDGQVHALPALAPGATAPLGPQAGRPARDALERAALSRAGPDRPAALWALDLSGVSQVPAGSRGWLLVSAAP